MGWFDVIRRRRMPAKIKSEMAARAADFIESWRRDDSPVDAVVLDYSQGSLTIIDGILGDYHRRGETLPTALHAQVSAYVFEVVRRTHGGRYLSEDGTDQIVLITGEPRCQIAVMVMGKVSGRVRNGPEDNIPFFVEGIGPMLARGESATLL